MSKTLKITLYIVLGIICFGLGFLASYLVGNKTKLTADDKKVTTTTVKKEKASKEEAAFKKILNNEMKFNAALWDDTEVNEYYLKNYVPVNAMGYKISKYTYVDLDGNGTKELIIEGTQTNNRAELLDDYYLVFNYVDGKVDCYTFFWKEFASLKKDGTLAVKYASSVRGIVKITKFNSITSAPFEKFESEQLAMEDKEDATMINYTIDGKEVTEEEYKAYEDKFIAKEEPEWTEYK